MGSIIEVRKTNALLVLIAVTLLAIAVPARAQQKAEGDAEKPSPVTTSDPEIPVDHLKLLVKPLTLEELKVEADGWRDLVKAKTQEMGQQRIASLEKAKQVEVADEAASAKAKQKQGESQSAKVDAETAKDEHLEIAEEIPEMKEEQTKLIDRLNVVVDALEAKGGEVEPYRQYISAVSGLDLHVTDARTAWTVIQGWLTSEQGGQRWLWNIVKFLIILIAFYFAASIIAGLVRRGARRLQNTSQLLVNFLGKFVKQALMLIGLVVALSALEVPISPMLAAIGAAGFVIGFALQDTLSNFASGLMILAYRPFDEGDVIDAAGVSGVVDSVSLFSTHIRTFDNKEMIVPNNDIWGGTITNASAHDTRRVDMVFGIGYDDDVDKAKGILESLVNGHELVLEDPAPTVQMNELGDSSINFICRPWAKTSDYWTVYWDITRAVKQEFDRNGISIPFPQRDIHVYHQNAGAGATEQHTA